MFKTKILQEKKSHKKTVLQGFWGHPTTEAEWEMAKEIVIEKGQASHRPMEAGCVWLFLKKT